VRGGVPCVWVDGVKVVEGVGEGVGLGGGVEVHGLYQLAVIVEFLIVEVIVLQVGAVEFGVLWKSILAE